MQLLSSILVDSTSSKVLLLRSEGNRLLVSEKAVGESFGEMGRNDKRLTSAEPFLEAMCGGLITVWIWVRFLLDLALDVPGEVISMCVTSLGDTDLLILSFTLFEVQIFSLSSS